MSREAISAFLVTWGLQVLGGLLAFGAVFVAARFVRRFATQEMARQKVRTDAAVLAARVIYVALIALGVFLFITISLGNAAVGFTGVLFAAFITSLGLQDLFKNYVSGFYVAMERNFKLGDQIECGGYRGVVTEIAMRVTYLRAEDGTRIVVPNSLLFTNTVSIATTAEGGGPASS